MEKNEIRAVIKYFNIKGLTPKEVINELNSTLGESAPSNATVYNWFAEFKRGRTSTSDAERSGRPKDASTKENIAKIHDLVLKDRKLKLREISQIVNISHNTVFHIIHNDLGMRKLCARWVPRSLTIDQKHERVTKSKECLAMFKRNKSEFLRRYITVDETWVHHYTPETQEQAKQWVSPGESAPKRPKTQTTAGKVMATIFWDSHGVIFIDYLEKGKTINSEYYTQLLDHLKEEIGKKRPHLAKKKVLFHQDNAPPHKSMKTMSKLAELHFELLPHPPYSPDLAPCDYYLFPNLKRWLAGKRFGSNNEVEEATNAYFEDFSQAYFLKGIELLEKRWTKCIELEGDYVEE